jgi:hypothetical protein
MADALGRNHEPATGTGTASKRATQDSPCDTTEDRDVRDGHDYTADPNSGYFGAGSNEGEGNDNLERETTPGFQADKWERGTIMPH